jgi:hypothetical protein
LGGGMNVLKGNEAQFNSKSMKGLFELYGLILGDGSYYLDREKYPNMLFFNFDAKLAKRSKKICEKIAQKKIKLSARKRKNGIEYSFHVPITVIKKLLKLGFSKKKLPNSIIRNKNAIFLLKGLYESDGTSQGRNIIIYQKNNEQLLKDCQKIANLYGFSAHIHTYNRKGEQSLVIENSNKLKKLFGKMPKKINFFQPKINGYYTTKRIILNFLNDNKWRKTSEIYSHLQKNGIKLSRKSGSLIKKHLNKLWRNGLLHKKDAIIERDKYGHFIKKECEWKIKIKLKKEEIMNFPYGVLK